MDIRKIYSTNEEKVTEGVWVPFGDAEIKLKRAGGSNKAFNESYEKAMKPHRFNMVRGKIDDETIRKININLYAKHIITDWKGIKEDGVEVPFSAEKFIEYATEFPEWWTEIVLAATEITNFQDDEDEELVKKPESSIDSN